ncbi:MAG: hypothetical protein WC889_13990, partial [Myxococcota bacterium]
SVITGGAVKNRSAGAAITLAANGWLPGTIGSGMFGWSYAMERNAAAGSKYRLSIYMAPWTPKPGFVSSIKTPDGAVAGISGTF